MNCDADQRELPELEPGQAVAVDWDLDTYHGSTDLVSRSMLDVLRASPAMFHKRFVLGQELASKKKEPKSLTLGTLLHVAVLEPDRWRGVLPPEPPRPEHADGRARKGTPERAAFDSWKMFRDLWAKVLSGDLTPQQHAIWLQIRTQWARAQGHSRPFEPIIVSGQQFELVSAMADAVRNHPFARELLADDTSLRRDGAPGYPCVNEQTIIWREPETGVLCRLRVDRLRDFASKGTMAVLDLKSTRDPSESNFAVSIARYGYHRQAAFYTDAVKALFPDRKVLYGLVAVRNEEPFDVGCYQLSEVDIDLGRQQYRESLVELVERRQQNKWTAPWQEWCRPIKMPAWAHPKDDR